MFFKNTRSFVQSAFINDFSSFPVNYYVMFKFILLFLFMLFYFLSKYKNGLCSRFCVSSLDKIYFFHCSFSLSRSLTYRRYSIGVPCFGTVSISTAAAMAFILSLRMGWRQNGTCSLWYRCSATHSFFPQAFYASGPEILRIQ